MNPPLAARRLAAVVAAVIILVCARVYADDGIAVVRLGFAERHGALVVKELGLSRYLFDQAAYHALEENPLPTVVVVRLYVYRKDRDQPVAYRLVTMRVVYDLWMARYQVRIDGPAGRHSGHYRRLDQAYRRITELADLPVADLDDIAIGPHYYLGIVAELNPVSEETLAEMRRWLTRPAGTTSLERGTSFFGSFVSIFVNARPPEADRVARLRSQPFYRVPR